MVRIRRIDIEGTPEELDRVDITTLVEQAAEETTPAESGTGGTGAGATRDSELKKLVERHGP